MTRRIPKQERSRQRKDEIIRVAARIIEEQGYEQFSTNALAKKAGIGVASIYDYFENKEAIVIAVFDREIADIWKSVEPFILRLLRSDSGESEATEIVEALLDQVVSRSEIIRIAAGYFHGASEFPAGIRFFSQVEGALRLILSRYQDSGETSRELDAFLLTHALLGMGIGISRGLPAGKTSKDVAEWIADFMSREDIIG